MKTELMTKLSRNIPKAYIFSFLFGLTFFLPIVVLFWQERGLSLTEIMLLQAIGSVLIVALEVPTGYFADIFGRRPALILAAVGLFVVELGYVFAGSFWYFVGLEIFWAIALGLYSGTFSALVYDSLLSIGREKLYKKTWGRSAALFMLGGGVANLLGGVMAASDLVWPFVATAMAYGLLVPLSLTFVEPTREKPICERGYLRDLLATVKKTFTDDPKLRSFILYSGFVSAMLFCGLWLYQPYFVASGLPVVAFGVVFTLFQMVAAVSSHFTERVEQFFGQKTVMLSFFLLTAISFGLMSVSFFVFGFVLIFLQQIVRGLSEPITSEFINRLTDSSHRATVISVQSLVMRAFMAVFLPLIGYAADVYSLQVALIFCAGLTLFFGGAFVVTIRKNGVV